MNKYVFNIRQNFNGHIDDQNVWTLANSEAEARRKIQREWHSIVGMTLIMKYTHKTLQER